MAPHASADAPAAPTASSSPAAPGMVARGAHAHSAPRPADSTTPVTPDFGFQKIRVGVQIKSGAWVPPGTDTGGSAVAIAETGPNAAIAAAVNGTSCDTVAGSETAGSSETFCEFHMSPTDAARVRAAATKAGEALPADVPSSASDYLAFPGDTVTFTQTSANPNLLVDPEPHTVGPCITDGTGFPSCPASGDAVDVTLNDSGLPPTAHDDAATVVSGKLVGIDVLANDVTHGAPAQILSTSKPRHGQVSLGVSVSGSSDPSQQQTTTWRVEYQSAPGFVGTDSFTYTMSTPNGRSTAPVHVTVTAPPPTAVDDSAHTTSGHAVTVDVLANDRANGGGALRVASVGQPGHGTAAISGGTVVYTPASGFTGTDTFTYTAATDFGTDTATVTVTVSAIAPLANTGSPSGDIADIGALLLLAGGAATVVGRRRYRAKHAGLG